MAYVRRLEALVGAPIFLLTTSPERDDLILLKDPFSRTERPPHSTWRMKSSNLPDGPLGISFSKKLKRILKG